MKIHELNVKAKKNRQRVGRGISAGQGKTAGRGTKGQNSRSGGGVRPGFEGGQNPLAQRIPKKPGFTPVNRIVYQPVNIDDLSRKFKAGAKVTIARLHEEGLISNPKKPVKVLGRGKLDQKLTVEAQAISTSARQAVEAAGGTIKIIEKANAKAKATTK